MRLHDGRRVGARRADHRHRLRGRRHQASMPGDRAAGPHAARHLVTRRAGLSGHDGGGFPNLFTIIGPNTGLGHNSMVFIIEAQLAFIDDAMRELKFHAWLSPTADAQERFNDELQPAPAAHGVGHRLQQLVPPRRRPHHHAVARVHAGIPAPHTARAGARLRVCVGLKQTTPEAALRPPPPQRGRHQRTGKAGSAVSAWGRATGVARTKEPCPPDASH